METNIISEQPGRFGIQTRTDNGNAWNVYHSRTDAGAGSNSTGITAEAVYGVPGSCIGMGSDREERGAEIFFNLYQ